jgi:hypothetical protein
MAQAGVAYAMRPGGPMLPVAAMSPQNELAIPRDFVRKPDIGTMFISASTTTVAGESLSSGAPP